MPTRDVVRITLVVAATALGLFALYRIRHVLLLVGIAAFLALALEPGVTFLQKRLKSRSLAVGLMITMILLFVGLFFASVAPPIVRQTQSLVRQFPELKRTTLDDPTTPLGRIEKQFNVTERLEKGSKTLTRSVSSLPRVFGTIVGYIADFLVVLVLTIYFLLHSPAIKKEGVKLMPKASRKRTAQVSEIVFAKVGGWMEGNALISVIAGIVSFIGLIVIGVPYPAALAMWVAIADLIPMVGAMLGAVVCVTVAFFGGIVPGVATAIFFLVYQQIENYLIGPRVMKRAVDVSPASVIISALVGGTLLGPVGVLLAVPAAASLKVIANEVRRPEPT
ncbi:MAG: AI-2E family transporter [Actinomycetota bacterium]